VTFTVEALAIPQGDAPTLDGTCNDDPYTVAATLPLKPYADGSQASVQLLRSDTKLWACFSGLQRTSGSSSGSFATLRVDANHSQDASPQPDDLEYAFLEDGTAFIRKGSGGREAPSADTIDSRVSSDGTTWNVEISIVASEFGGWDHLISLMLDHNWVTYQGDDHSWPYTSVWDKPDTWATTVLGVAPQLEQVSPGAAAVGSPTKTVTVTGNNFSTDAMVLWNGNARPTTFVSATQLQVEIPAADFADTGVASITVANGAGGASSNSLPFFVSRSMSTSAGTTGRIFLPLIHSR
jgi:hypothetical protein